MNILLVCPRYGFEGYAPTGLASIASVAVENNHDVTVCDLNVQQLPKKKFDLVGVTGMSFWKKEIVKTVQHFKDTPTIVGGPYATQMTLNVFEETGADYICVGEGERTFEEFLSEYPDVFNVKGIGCRVTDAVMHRLTRRSYIKNLDKTPVPLWSKLALEKYVKVPVETARGCPYDCVFCAVKVYEGKQWRAKSAYRVVREIAVLEDLGVKRVTMSDANLTYNVERMMKICELIVTTKIKMQFDVMQGVRADKLSDELLISMKKAGFVEIIIAPESGSQRVVNEIIGKRLDLSKVEPVVRKCREIGLNIGAFFVIGFPHETREEIQQTIRLAEKLRSLGCSSYVGNALPLFHTRLYKQAKKEGFLRFDNGKLEEVINEVGLPRTTHCLSSPHWKPEEIIQITNQQNLLNQRAMLFNRSKSELLLKSVRHPVRALKRLRRVLH